jgi:hypothetical protein
VWSLHSFRQWPRADKIALFTLLAALVGAVIAYRTWWEPHVESELHNTVNNSIEAKFEQSHFDQVVGDVQAMKGRLDEMDGFLRLLTERELHQQATLSKSEFENQIPTIAATVSAARLVHTSAPPDLITDISKKLAAAAPTAPDYWKAAGELLSYRSELKNNFVVQQLPNCLQGQAAGGEFEGNTFNMSVMVFMSRCVLDLDADNGANTAAFDHYVARLVAGGPQSAVHYSLDLTDAIVIYHGGTILPITKFVMHNCLFQVQTRDDTPAPAKYLTRELLASDTPTIKVDLPTSG